MARASAGSTAAAAHPAAAAVAAPSWGAHGGAGADGDGGGAQPPLARPCRSAGVARPCGTARSSAHGSASASVQSEIIVMMGSKLVLVGISIKFLINNEQLFLKKNNNLINLNMDLEPWYFNKL